MRRYFITKALLLILIIVVLFTGCGKEKEESPKNKSKSAEAVDIDFDYKDSQNFSFIKSGAFSKDGFYTYDENKCQIYFIDKNSKKMTTLCCKPNCKHTDDSCNAYFDNAQGVYVNNGYVYVMSDGYLAINWSEKDSSKEREQLLYRVSLDGKDKEELFKVKGYSPMIYIDNTFGDNVYFNSDIYKNPNLGEKEIKGYCYNIKDGSVKELPVPKGQMFEVCYDDCMYSMIREQIPGSTIVKKLEFFVSDMDGNNNKSVYSMENADTPILFCDNVYWYIVQNLKGEQHLTIINHNGEEVCEYNCGNDKYPIWSDMENLLLKNNKTGEYILYNIISSEETVIKSLE